MKAISKVLQKGETTRKLPGAVLYLCVFLLATPSLLYAQSGQVVTHDDRAPITARYPTPDHLHDLQTDRAYQYGTDAPPPDNPLGRFLAWLFGKLDDFMRSEAYQNVWQYVILIAIAGLVIYLLMKAETLAFLFPKKAQTSELDYENLAENIHEIDFDAAINEAISQRNFRLAVRLHYLQTLKRLTDTSRIDYKPEKTNRQYVYELAKSSLQADFALLTRQFEFVWYGDFPVDNERYQQISQPFRAFNQRIDQPDPLNLKTA